MKEHVVPCALLDDMTTVVDHYALPKREDISQVMRHQEHGNTPTRMHLGQFLSHGLPQHIIKSRKRLIEQEQTWLHSESASQSHPLLLPTRELARQTTLESLHAKELQEFCHPLRTYAP